MRFTNTEINVFYNNIENMRRKSIEIEDMLARDFVTPFTIVPVPDEAPPEIPRLVGKTKEGHTEIQISKIATKLIIRYDNDYSVDWKKCENYATDKINLVYNVLDPFVNYDYKFVGIINNIMIQEENPKKFIAEKFIKTDDIERIEELNTRVAFIKDKKFYTNLQISSIKADIGDKSKNQSKLIEAINFNLDVNDRFRSNFIKDYKSSKDIALEALSISTGIISSKIEEILESGVIKL